MASISTGIGLISGINIEDVVTKLMDIEKRPLNDLQTRIDDINSKKTLFVSITALLLKLKLDTTPLQGDGNVFTSRTATSSNQSVITASAQKGTALGNYYFTVKSLVQAHQMVSGGYSGTDATVGSGTITIEMGNGNVNRATTLDSLNGGAGVAAGSLYITDRSGRSVAVDVSGAITVQDVVDDINSTTGVGVTASISGDHMVLTDTTGQTAHALQVEEVSGGTTAADLGILGSAAGNVLTGTDVVAISGETFLDSLNDGLGVRNAAGLNDFRITRRDGVQIDVSVSSAQSVHDVLDTINNDTANGDGKLTASVSADGKGITLADTTGGTGDLSVTALNGSEAANDLGILESVSADTLVGGRVVSELNTVLLRSLNGGSGVAAGSIRITNRQGVSADVDLSGAKTLSQAMTLINSAGVNVTAALNQAKTGLSLTDSSGGSGTLSVEEVGSTTAADLGILKSVSSNTLRGDNAQLQYIGEQTLLSTLNNGSGVYAGKFRIMSRNGASAVIDLSQSDDTRIEDVISEINSSGLNVRASINSTGDGILLTDSSGGTGTFKVEDVGGGTTAADLKLTGSAPAGDPTHIDGSFEYHVSVTSSDTIQQIASKIASSGAQVASTLINDGSRTSPYRVSVVSKVAGTAGQMVVDTGDLNLQFTTTQQARDAALLYGQNMPGSQRMLVKSSSNTITGIVNGLTLNLVGTSDTPVSVSVTSDDEAAVTAVSDFVTDWNNVIDKIQEVTKYDTTSQTAGPLLGDPTVQRIEAKLDEIINRTVTGASPNLNRLSRIGVSFMETGKLSFDDTKMRSMLASKRDDVEKLITLADTGFGDYAANAIDGMTDENTGVIRHKSDEYDGQIKVFQEQADSLTARLAKVQDQLYEQFYSMEEALALLETQKTAIDNMQNLFATSTTKKSSS